MPCHEGIRWRGVRASMIVCGRQAHAKRCVVCQTHDNLKLCDYPLAGPKHGQTCNRPVCGTHATHQEPDFDLCPSHARIVAAQQQALLLGPR